MFPRAPARAHIQIFEDFFVASTKIFDSCGGVFLISILFGDGAVLSNVDDCSYIDDIDCSDYDF